MCPKCDHETCRVLETRRVDCDVYRRRQCESCSFTFISVETTSPRLMFPWASDVPKRSTAKPRKTASLRDRVDATSPASSFAGWKRPASRVTNE